MVSETRHACDAGFARILDAVVVQVVPDPVAQRGRVDVVAEVGGQVGSGPPATVTVYGSTWLLLSAPGLRPFDFQ